MIKISDTVSHQRRIFARINQPQIEALLAKIVAEQVGFPMNNDANYSVMIGRTTAMVGSEYYAEVTITENLFPEGGNS